MASAELRCSLCLNIYTDPVTLKCGHNFCRECIDRALDTQEGSGGYFCPECRKRFRSRPALQGNKTARNIPQPSQEESGVFCAYCVDPPVPAVRSCLCCEAYLCEKHLRVHKKATDHILSEPTTSLQKCSTHNELLKYYCINDGNCICASCSLDGKHKEHQVEILDEASEKKKETLRNVLACLLTKREEMEERVQCLQEHWRKVEEKADGDTERVTALFRELRRRLEDLEKTVLRDISGQAKRVSISMLDMIQKLEIKKEELSRKMRHIEELCNMTDPLTVLQESDTGDLCDTEDGDNEDRERHEKLLHDGGGLDVAGVLHTGLSDIITEVNVYFYIQGATDISLDVNTAHNHLYISDNRKTASILDRSQNHPKTPERFQCPQVLSSQSFCSGQYYWEVDVGGSNEWRIGMCYPSIERVGWKSVLGENNKSWGLYRSRNQYWVIHDSYKIILPGMGQSPLSPEAKRHKSDTPVSCELPQQHTLQALPCPCSHTSRETPREGTYSAYPFTQSCLFPYNISTNKVRIYLNYEAGQISFYGPAGHLHTFTTTFTESLHAVLCVWEGCINICGGYKKI